MVDDAIKLIRSLRTEEQLAHFISRLHVWLLEENASPSAETMQFPESRARALMRATDVADEETIDAFRGLVSTNEGARVALYDLLINTELAQSGEVRTLVETSSNPPAEAPVNVSWLSLALAGFAQKRGYPLAQLDPASPPQRYSPAGQVVKAAATFVRRQIQRSASERTRLARSLAPRDPASGAALDELQADGTIPPLPPHFRSPIPVRYPEMTRETLQIEPVQDSDAPPSSRGEPLVISEEDLAEEGSVDRQDTTEDAAPRHMPPIRIAREQVRETQLPSPVPSNAVLMPANRSDARSGLTVALRQMFSPDELLSTKLRVVAQAYPDGPGLFGLQVKISCKGIRSYVAGTTNRQGQFVAELPVKQAEGLTYDVDLTWPRDMGGETERKSMTLHADRTEFLLPFYHRLEAISQDDDERSA